MHEGPTPRTPQKAIRAFCVSCVGGSYKEVERCTGFECPLWKYRFGKRPKTVKKRRPQVFDPEYIRQLHESEKRYFEWDDFDFTQEVEEDPFDDDFSYD